MRSPARGRAARTQAGRSRSIGRFLAAFARPDPFGPSFRFPFGDQSEQIRPALEHRRAGDGADRSFRRHGRITRSSGAKPWPLLRPASQMPQEIHRAAPRCGGVGRRGSPHARRSVAFLRRDRSKITRIHTSGCAGDFEAQLGLDTCTLGALARIAPRHRRNSLLEV